MPQAEHETAPYAQQTFEVLASVRRKFTAEFETERSE
jgi:hypothetical protein